MIQKLLKKGSADKIYINTAGIGLIDEEVNISPVRIETGDIIIVSGTIGDHGIAILSKRKEFDFKTDLKSDCAPLSPLVAELISVSSNIHAIRDATRGGLARVLFELASTSKHDFEISNAMIPIKRETKGICEFLGMDPLYVANEGKMVFFVSGEDAFSVLEAARKNKYGRDASIIGKVTKKGSGRVILNTEIGTNRILDLYYSEQPPKNASIPDPCIKFDSRYFKTSFFTFVIISGILIFYFRAEFIAVTDIFWFNT